MKSKHLIVFLLGIVAFFIAQDIYARAGGSVGGGGRGFGGGGIFSGGYYGHGYYYNYGAPVPVNDTIGWILVTFTLIFFSIVIFGASILIRSKVNGSLKTIKIASKSDAIWDEEKLKKYSIHFFYELQSAWSKNDLKPIKHHLTESFFKYYQNFLARYQRKKLVNMVSDIEIKKVDIVSVIDKLDNSKDTFAVLINGNMIDYLKNQKSGSIIEGDSEKSISFKDVYVFQRNGNSWLLNQIINNPSTGQILNFKDETE